MTSAFYAPCICTVWLFQGAAQVVVQSAARLARCPHTTPPAQKCGFGAIFTSVCALHMLP